ncbi:MAG: MFS transporter [Candidatus Helarchaeota archaeon]
MNEKKSYFTASFSLFLINLFLGIPGGIGLAILSRYLEELFNLSGFIGLATGMTFLTMSLHVLMKGIASPICGHYADKKGRRFTVIWGGIISLIGSSLLLISSFNLLILAFLGTLIIGAGRGFFMTSFNIIAGDTGEKYNKIGRTESLADGLYLIGAIIGGASSLVLKDQPYSSFLILIFIFFIIGFLIVIIFLNETLKSGTIKTNESSKFSYKKIIKHENFFSTFMFAFTVEGAESGYILTTLPILLVDFVSPDKSALFSTFPFSLGLGLFFLIAGEINDRKGRKFTALMGLVLIILFSILASFLMISPGIIFIIVFLMSGSSSLVRSTIESTWTDVSIPENRGKTYGIFRFFNELGGVVQPLIMSILLFYSIPIYFSAILVAIFAVISLICGKLFFKETLKSK